MISMIVPPNENIPIFPKSTIVIHVYICPSIMQFSNTNVKKYPATSQKVCSLRSRSMMRATLTTIIGRQLMSRPTIQNSPFLYHQSKSTKMSSIQGLSRRGRIESSHFLYFFNSFIQCSMSNLVACKNLKSVLSDKKVRWQFLPYCLISSCNSYIFYFSNTVQGTSPSKIILQVFLFRTWYISSSLGKNKKASLGISGYQPNIQLSMISLTNLDYCINLKKIQYQYYYRKILVWQDKIRADYLVLIQIILKVQMQSSQQKHYIINNSRVQSASSSNFNGEMIPTIPTKNGEVSKRDAYLKEQNFRQSLAPERPSNPRLPEYSVKSIVIENVGQKKKTLQKYKYINQLARLEYEDKEEEVYSRYTRISKATITKKIKARNQIAEFEDQDENENQWFDELMEFKFGKEKNSKFHYEKEE